MSDLVTKFEAYLLTEKRVAKNTFDAYRRDIAQLMKYLNEKEQPIEHAGLEDLKQFLHHLYEHKIGPRSLSRKISCIKAFYRYLNEYHNLENHAINLVFPKLEKRLPEYLSEFEVEALLKATNKDTSPVGVRNKAIVYLLYVSGMRISELVTLKKTNVHFDTGFIVVQGKGGKERQIPIPKEVVTLLNEYFQAVHPHLTRQGDTTFETDLAFPVLYGRRIKAISRQALWLILKKLARTAGIKELVSPHKLRHSLATHMLKKGADLRSLQLLLGHEHLSTVQVYTHLDTEHLRDIYDKKHPRS